MAKIYLFLCYRIFIFNSVYFFVIYLPISSFVLIIFLLYFFNVCLCLHLPGIVFIKGEYMKNHHFKCLIIIGKIKFIRCLEIFFHIFLLFNLEGHFPSIYLVFNSFKTKSLLISYSYHRKFNLMAIIYFRLYPKLIDIGQINLKLSKLLIFIFLEGL